MYSKRGEANLGLQKMNTENGLINFFLKKNKPIKGIVPPHMNILALITHPHVVPNS